MQLFRGRKVYYGLGVFYSLWSGKSTLDWRYYERQTVRWHFEKQKLRSNAAKLGLENNFKCYQDNDSECTISKNWLLYNYKKVIDYPPLKIWFLLKIYGKYYTGKLHEHTISNKK